MEETTDEIERYFLNITALSPSAEINEIGDCLLIPNNNCHL